MCKNYKDNKQRKKVHLVDEKIKKVPGASEIRETHNRAYSKLAAHLLRPGKHDRKKKKL